MRSSNGALRCVPGPLRAAWRGRARRALAYGLLAVPIAGCGRFGYDEWLVPIGAAGSGDGGAGGSGGAGAGGDASGGSAGRDALGNGGAGGSGGDGGAASLDAGMIPSGAGGAAGSSADSGSPPAPTPTCSDGWKNGGEDGVDCGGARCAPCPCAFGAPELLGDPNLAGNDILAVSLSVDALTMYIGGRVQGGSRPLATTTRPNRGGNFAFADMLPAPLNEDPAVEGTPFISRSGLVLIFFSERAGGAGDRDLYSSQRASTGAAFNSVTRLVSVNSPQRDHAPWLSPDLLTLYFSTRRAAGNDDIWRATRASSGVSFANAAPVTEFGSSGNDVGITLTDDGLVAYFASNRAAGLGGMDIYRATRAAPSDPFSTPEPVPDLNTNDDDAAPQLTADAKELFFVSNRNGSDSQVFRVSTTCP